MNQLVVSIIAYYLLLPRLLLCRSISAYCERFRICIPTHTHTNIFNIIYTKLMRCFIATHSYYFCCYYFYVYYVRLFKLPAFVVAHFLFDKLPNFYDCKYRSQRQRALTHFIKVIAKFRNFVNGSCQTLLFLSIFLLLLFMFFQAYLECSSFAFVALSAIYHICILPHCCCRVTTMYCWSFVATAVSPSTKNVGEIYSFFNSSSLSKANRAQFVFSLLFFLHSSVILCINCCNVIIKISAKLTEIAFMTFWRMSACKFLRVLCATLC